MIRRRVLRGRIDLIEPAPEPVAQALVLERILEELRIARERRLRGCIGPLRLLGTGAHVRKPGRFGDRNKGSLQLKVRVQLGYNPRAAASFPLLGEILT